jgi:hypothetical protein
VKGFGLKRPGSEVEAAAGTSALTPTAAFAGGVNYGVGWGTGLRNLVTADFPAPPVAGVFDRLSVLTIPAISRGRDLLCAAVGSLPLELWTYKWQENQPIEESVPPATWMLRPDPNKTRQHILAWTVDDLIFYARAYWRITARYQTGYPSSFERMIPTDVHIDGDGRVTYHGADVDPIDVVEFDSFTESVLVTGWRSLNTTMQLEAAADRYAATELPVGVLKQTGGEPLDSAELTAIADDFTARRRANAVAALGLDIDYSTQSNDPERMQLIEARSYQDLESARLMNIPPFLVGAPAGTSMTYQNAEQARRDLIDFGALPFIQCIEQTLSGPNVTPRGQFVRLSVNAWLRSPFTEGSTGPNDAETAFNTEPEPASEPAAVEEPA